MEAYTRLEPVGRGSFGTVHKVRRNDTGQILVCKAMSYGSMSEREKALIVSEVNILRELRHPHIVRYMDRIIDKRSSKIYIMMEYCQGGDLGRIIKRRKRERRFFEEHRIWKLFSQLLMAFEECHLHKEGDKPRPILHRDVKPGNILIDALGNAKLGDFGLAKELTSESRFAYTNVGTPYYMPPEMVNETKYNEKVDIWSIGCLIYEMAALRPPFEAKNVVALGAKINAGVFERIPGIFSEPLQQTIDRMLRTNPAQRPSVTELLQLPNIAMLVNEVKMAERKQQLTAELNNMLADVKAREVQVDHRECEVAEREYAVREQEDRLRQMVLDLDQREQNHTTAVAAFELQQQENRYRLSSVASACSVSSSAASSSSISTSMTRSSRITMTALTPFAEGGGYENVPSCDRCGVSVDDCACETARRQQQPTAAQVVALLKDQRRIISPTHSMASSTSTASVSDEEEARSIHMQWSAPRSALRTAHRSQRPHGSSPPIPSSSSLSVMAPIAPPTSTTASIYSSSRSVSSSSTATYSSPAASSSSSSSSTASNILNTNMRRIVYQTPPATKRSFDRQGDDEKENQDINVRMTRGRSYSREASPSLSPTSSLRGTGRPRSPSRRISTKTASDENVMPPPQRSVTRRSVEVVDGSTTAPAKPASNRSGKRHTLQRTRPRSINSSRSPEPTTSTATTRSTTRSRPSRSSERQASLASYNHRVTSAPSKRAAISSNRQQLQPRLSPSSVSSASSAVSGVSHKTSKTSTSASTSKSATSRRSAPLASVTATTGVHRRHGVADDARSPRQLHDNSLSPKARTNVRRRSSDTGAFGYGDQKVGSLKSRTYGSARAASGEPVGSNTSSSTRLHGALVGTTTRSNMSSARSVVSSTSTSSSKSGGRSVRSARVGSVVGGSKQYTPSIRTVESGLLSGGITSRTYSRYRSVS